LGKLAEYVILRFFGAYGPYEPARKIFTRLIDNFYFGKKNSFTIRGNGENLIDAMYINDAVEGIIKVVLSDERNLRETAAILGKEAPEIVYEGETDEYIEFWASPEEMERRFQFKPKISLAEGIKRFLEFKKELVNG